MSLSRLMLRGALVRALTNDFKEPYPTIAGPAVWDTKMDPVEVNTGESMLPIVVIYTDADQHMLLDRGEGRVFREHQVTCYIEIALGTFPEAPEGQKISYVETDAELEAMLDLFEYQVWYQIQNQWLPSTGPLHGLVKRIEGWESAPARQVDQNSRLSMRQITLDVVLKPDCLPQALLLPGGAAPPAYDKPDSLDVIKDLPYLTELQETLLSNPDFAGLCDQLRAVQSGRPSVTVRRLETASFKADVLDPQVDPNRLPAGTSPLRGPDGRIEYEWTIKLNE